MRVLIATPLYPPDVGGPATYSKLLVEGLPAHDIEVTMVNFGQFRHLPVGVRHILYLVRLMRDARGANVLYALDPWSTGVPTMLAALFLRKTFMVRIAGDYAWEQASGRYGIKDSLEKFIKSDATHPLFIEILKRGERLVARRAVAVVVPSTYLKKIIAHWGIARKKIHVIHNGVPDLHAQGSRRTLRGLLRFQGKLVVSAGRLIPLKRFDTLVRLVPDVLNRFSDFKLMIIGEGPERDRLERLVKHLKLDKNVILAGALEQRVLFRYIKAADLLVLNSTHETFSHLLLEAQSIGTPVIAAKVGGNPEIIADGVSGILVPSGQKQKLREAIERVLADAPLARRLASGARRRAKQFSEKRAVHELATLLRRI